MYVSKDEGSTFAKEIVISLPKFKGQKNQLRKKSKQVMQWQQNGLTRRHLAQIRAAEMHWWQLLGEPLSPVPAPLLPVLLKSVL